MITQIFCPPKHLRKKRCRICLTRTTALFYFSLVTFLIKTRIIIIIQLKTFTMETIINYFKDLNDTSIFLPYIFICYCAVVLIFCGAVTKLIYLGIKYYKK